MTEPKDLNNDDVAKEEATPTPEPVKLDEATLEQLLICLLYTSPSPRD